MTRHVLISVQAAAVVCLLALGPARSRADGPPQAADGADVRTLAVLTGGFSEQELRDAGALDVFDRSTSCAVMQHHGRAGCLTAAGPPACLAGRGPRGASSIVVSPDGRYVYAAAFKSNAVDVFRRVVRPQR